MTLLLARVKDAINAADSAALIAAFRECSDDAARGGAAAAARWGGGAEASDPFSQTALHLVCEAESVCDADTLACARVVLDGDLGRDGTLINATDNWGRTVLHWVCDRGKLGSLRYFLGKEGVNANAVTNHRDTPLLWAVKAGRTDVVRAMLELVEDIDVGVENNRGESALELCRDEPTKALLKDALEKRRREIESAAEAEATAAAARMGAAGGSSVAPASGPQGKAFSAYKQSGPADSDVPKKKLKIKLRK